MIDVTQSISAVGLRLPAKRHLDTSVYGVVRIENKTGSPFQRV